MLYEVTVPQFIEMLKNLIHLLDKAAIYASLKKFEVDVLLHSRLAPDQFDLIQQVHLAGDIVELGVSGLIGRDFSTPENPEKTLPELKTRIESILHHLHAISQKDFQGAEERKISLPWWGEDRYLTGSKFVLQYALPSFYFHVTIVYSILRHNGVELGKKDYLGELPLSVDLENKKLPENDLKTSSYLH